MTLATADRRMAGFRPIDLARLQSTAELLVRRDRKYLLGPEQLDGILAALHDDALALEIDGRRSFGYASTYFDTPEFVSYRMAATGRPRRFKLRVRRYLDSDLVMLEMKTRSRRGDTVKRRIPLAPGTEPDQLDSDARRWIADFDETAGHADALAPVITTRYERSTLVFPGAGARATIDTRLECTDPAGRSRRTGDLVILESKSAGPPSMLDRLLWDRGIRPTRISKFAFGVAALHPHLPANRWNRALRYPGCAEVCGTE